MRELKFRAWDKRKRIMVYRNENESADYWDGVFGSEIEMINALLNDSSYVFMQFTGLHDRNGQEIYEGDILKNDYGDIWVVVWNGTGFRLALFGDSKGIYSANEYYFSSCEVIGNIFQDGDLLDSEISKVDRD